MQTGVIHFCTRGGGKTRTHSVYSMCVHGWGQRGRGITRRTFFMTYLFQKESFHFLDNKRVLSICGKIRTGFQSITFIDLKFFSSSKECLHLDSTCAYTPHFASQEARAGRRAGPACVPQP